MGALILYYSSLLLLCGIMYFIRSQKVQHLFFIPFLGTQVGLTIFCIKHAGEAVDGYFKIDGVAVIFMSVLTVLAGTTAWHAVLLAIRKNETYKTIALHHSLLMILIGMMSGVLISSHLGLLCAFLEATTMASALLIYRDRSKKNFEEAWKYFFVSSIGIVLVFVGILFIMIAGKEANISDTNPLVLMRTIPFMDPLWLKISFIFVLAGLSVKIGVAPLFNAVVDAKDTAPLHISALFSGSMTIVGFVALFRFYELFSISPALNHWMNSVVIITGIISILCATLYTIKTDNYRRLLAYSSVAHAGLVLIALGTGQLGYVAAILHLICHAFIKAALFYQFGNVYWLYNTNESTQTGNYFRQDSMGGVLMLITLFMILAIPPSGLCMSEFMLIKSLLFHGRWLVMVLMLLLFTLLFASFAKKILAFLFLPMYTTRDPERKVKAYEVIPQIVLLLLVIWIGINPPLEMIQYVEAAIAHLPR